MALGLTTRVYGSDDLFPGDAVSARRPYQSLNYVASHDGFTRAEARQARVYLKSCSLLGKSEDCGSPLWLPS